MSALCLGVGGCGPKLSKPAKELLIGTWAMQIELDDDKFENMLRKTGKKPEDNPKATDLAKSLMVGLKYSLTLTADGTYEEISVMPGQRKKTINGTWEVINEDASVVTYKMTEKTGVETQTASFRNDDEFEWAADSDLPQELPLKTPIVFKRQK